MIEKVSCSGEKLIQLIQDDVGVGIVLDINDDAHRLFQIALVANARDAFDLFIADQRSDAFDNAIAELLEGNLADDDARLVLDGFHRRTSPQHDRAATGLVALMDSIATANNAAGREVGPRHDFDQLIDRHIGVIDYANDPGTDLAQVVRWNAGGHADSDAGRAVDQQIGNLDGNTTGSLRVSS